MDPVDPWIQVIHGSLLLHNKDILRLVKLDFNMFYKKKIKGGFVDMMDLWIRMICGSR